jgi:hypothetical protein
LKGLYNFNVLSIIQSDRLSASVSRAFEVSEFISAFRPFSKRILGCLYESQKARGCGLAMPITLT